ncbi:Transcription factor BYE1 [Neolecta irregularis DAH-3]|uniref:Transcription factor BYE1 n=1 Tax=Neolecta irregularis (strain DAH-3) TaxID=1198029 RepID=A0A1U7LGX1_NEOID|nr:Transcription factor BYE1 [Neolecta irregularis DAH-3]|eukprot:OLL21905.1 Transcription factor BYE1 [Neolecta irregularis DAH-3]
MYGQVLSIRRRTNSQRVDTIGYDNKGYMYYILDNSYMYRAPDPEFPYRHSKKRKRGQTVSEESELAPMSDTWECVATTVEEYDKFILGLNQTKGDEKKLYIYLTEEAIPEITQVIENRRIEKKTKQEEQAMANFLTPFRERSSRIFARDAARKEQEEKEAQEVKEHDYTIKKSRRDGSGKVIKPPITREQRLRERELRIMRQESVGASTGNEDDAASPPREAATPLLVQPKDSEGDWEFNCICGVKGENFDDGTLSVACEECNMWQHVECQGQEVEIAIRKHQADYLCFRCSKSGKPEIVAPKESKDDDDYEEIEEEEPEPYEIEVDEESDQDYRGRKSQRSSPKRRPKTTTQSSFLDNRPVFGGYIQQPANTASSPRPPTYAMQNYAIYIQQQQAILAHQRYLQSQGYHQGFNNQSPIRPNGHFIIPQNAQFPLQQGSVPYHIRPYSYPAQMSNPYPYQQANQHGPRPNPQAPQAPQARDPFPPHPATPLSPHVSPANRNCYPTQQPPRPPYSVPSLQQQQFHLYQQQPMMHSLQQHLSRPLQIKQYNPGTQNSHQEAHSGQWKGSMPEELTKESIKRDLLGGDTEDI